jgi:hypothetical protein
MGAIKDHMGAIKDKDFLTRMAISFSGRHELVQFIVLSLKEFCILL